MGNSDRKMIGFTCAYTPLALVHAAGFAPFRVLPLGDAPDAAGAILHDNLCPHVKRVLDRAVAGDLPELAGMIFMGSCDAMRRLADAWKVARPADRVAVVDLPVAADERAIAYFADEMRRLASLLAAWGGRPVDDGEVRASAAGYRELASGLAELAARAARGELSGGRRALQELTNRAVTQPLDLVLSEVRAAIATIAPKVPPGGRRGAGVPIYVFGNVLPIPEAFDLISECGALVADDDLCTGVRQLELPEMAPGGDALAELARALLARQPCARSVDPAVPGDLARRVLASARAAGARGVIAHVMKFCDPYLARLPSVRQSLAEARVPLLVLEGDCTLRSLGQYRTRIEAFIEMLEGGTPS